MRIMNLLYSADCSKGQIIQSRMENSSLDLDQEMNLVLLPIGKAIKFCFKPEKVINCHLKLI